MNEKFKYLQPRASGNLKRFGGGGDGGYVLSKKIVDQSDTLISFGVGQNIDFEREILKSNPAINVYMFDHTVKAPSKRNLLLNVMRSIYFFDRRHFTNSLKFYNDYKNLTKSAKHFQNKVTNLKWNKYDLHINEIIHTFGSDLQFMKIDIEGDEYKILPSIIEVIDKFTGLIVEFHHIDSSYEKFEKCVKDLQLTHDIEHLHGNNYSDLTSIGLPEVLEISFIRKDLNLNASPVIELPIRNLDYPNSSWRTDFMFKWK